MPKIFCLTEKTRKLGLLFQKLLISKNFLYKGWYHDFCGIFLYRKISYKGPFGVYGYLPVLVPDCTLITKIICHGKSIQLVLILKNNKATTRVGFCSTKRRLKTTGSLQLSVTTGCYNWVFQDTKSEPNFLVHFSLSANCAGEGVRTWLKLSICIPPWPNVQMCQISLKLAKFSLFLAELGRGLEFL